jgi:hypothetical protein
MLVIIDDATVVKIHMIPPNKINGTLLNATEKIKIAFTEKTSPHNDMN